jgi:hypothetical protein
MADRASRERATYVGQGSSGRYAEVVSRGDGFDSDGNVFRAMPHIYAIVAFFVGPESQRQDGAGRYSSVVHGRRARGGSVVGMKGNTYR